MPYTPNPTWQDSPSTTTPITAAALNTIEAGLVAVAKAADAGLPAALPVFNVEAYGAKGDGTTDDTAAINAALAALVTAYNAGGPGGVLLFPRPVTYLVSGALLTTNGCYAQIPLPALNAAASRKGTLIVKGPGPACVTGISGQTAVQSGHTAIVRSTLTGQTYSATYGWPSVFGFPDVDKAGGGPDGGTFSPWHVLWDGVIVRQPANPSLCALNFGTADGYELLDFYADTNVPQSTANSAALPTATTGLGFRGSHNNNNTQTRIVRAGALGYYGGIAIDEHTNAEYLLACACVVAHPILAGYYHGASVKHTVTEWNRYVLAGLDPTSGVVAIPGASGKRPGVRFDLLDLEDAPVGNPFVSVAHVYDPNDQLRGRINYVRIAANVGQVAGITVRGVSPQFRVDDLNAITGSIVPPVTASGALNDTFTRADSASSAGTLDSGQTWTALAGTWGISSNRLYSVDAATGTTTWYAIAADAGAGHATGTAAVDIVVGPETAGSQRTDLFLLTNVLDADNCVIVEVALLASGAVTIYSRVAGTFTPFVIGGGTPVSFAPGSTHRLQLATAPVSSTSLAVTLSLDGTTMGTVTVTGLPTSVVTSTRYGLGRLASTTLDSGTSRFDNFTVA